MPRPNAACRLSFVYRGVAHQSHAQNSSTHVIALNMSEWPMPGDMSEWMCGCVERNRVRISIERNDVECEWSNAPESGQFN